MQPNPEIEEAGGVKLAESEKEILLLELFPLVAKDFLKKKKIAAFEAAKPKVVAEPVVEKKIEKKIEITGFVVEAPLPGKIIEINVKVGQIIARDEAVATLEAMKMENSITSDMAGTVKRIFITEGDVVATHAPLFEIE